MKPSDALQIGSSNAKNTKSKVLQSLSSILFRRNPIPCPHEGSTTTLNYRYHVHIDVSCSFSGLSQNNQHLFGGENNLCIVKQIVYRGFKKQTHSTRNMPYTFCFYVVCLSSCFLALFLFCLFWLFFLKNRPLY